MSIDLDPKIQATMIQTHRMAKSLLKNRNKLPYRQFEKPKGKGGGKDKGKGKGKKGNGKGKNKQWKQMPDEEKRPYVEAEAADEQRYAAEVAAKEATRQQAAEAEVAAEAAAEAAASC